MTKVMNRIRESLPFVRRSEYEEVVHKIEALLSCSTGGRFSKSCYDLHDMERMVSDYEQELIDDAVEDETVCLRQKIEQLQDELDKFKAKQIRTSLYDKEEIHRNCTVHILSNIVTGEQSIGWWDNDNPPAVLNTEEL